MAFTRRHVATVLSIAYLLGLTVLAAYAMHSTRRYSLPIPNILSALTVALPPLAGLVLEATITLNQALAAKNQLSRSHIFQVVVSLLLVYETVIATLAGTHLYPNGELDCALKERWMKLFSAKNGKRISAIQDAFSCCGFQTVKHMAYPFQDAKHGTDACVVRYERDTPCLQAWRQEEKKVAGMLLAVPIAIFVWQLLVFAMPVPEGRSWFPSAPQFQTNEGRTIGYRDTEDTGGDEDSVFSEVRRLNDDSRLASEVEGGRSKPSALLHDRNAWNE